MKEAEEEGEEEEVEGEEEEEEEVVEVVFEVWPGSPETSVAREASQSTLETRVCTCQPMNAANRTLHLKLFLKQVLCLAFVRFDLVHICIGK